MPGCLARGMVWPVSEMPPSNSGPGPTPSQAERRELRSRANRLKARLTVGRKRLTDSLLAGVRGELERNELVKVRLDEEEAAEADALARELAERVPCHLIQRIGRVALLYRKPAEVRGEK